LNGQLKYRILCKESRVPTGKIYQVLSALESKGFVEVVQEKPKVVRAVEPKKALRKRLRQIEDDFFDLEFKTGEALKTLQLQYSSKYDVIQGIVNEIFVGSTSSARSIRENLAKAEDEVLISADEGINKLHFEEMFGTLVARGVSVRAIVFSPAGNSKDAFDRLIRSGASVRLFDSHSAEYIVVDDKCVYLAIDGTNEETFVHISGSALCRVLQQRFAETWVRAKPFIHELNSHKLISVVR
jgi:sugar-specific transcriptional regulator TrmB